jgi:D-glycero-alpha-D-manno-heptose-7-phosphate kinase
LIISQTPLRISFAGGGTDRRQFYQERDGRVVSAAINKYVFVIVKERFDENIAIAHSRNECVKRTGQIRHGLVREAMKKVGIENSVEIIILADIPSGGTGLGSSSSVTVGLLNAFYAYRGITVDAEALAREACDIEIDALGKPIGKQDQYIAAYGGLRLFEFDKDESVRVNAIDLAGSEARRFAANILLYYTGISRKADGVLKKLKQDDASVETLDRMTQQAGMICQLIRRSKYDEIGFLLDEAWKLKKSLARGITTPAIDRMYDAARRGGALGGKLCGAGGGGFLMVYCPRERQGELRAAMKDYRELPFRFEFNGSKIVFNGNYSDGNEL